MKKVTKQTKVFRVTSPGDLPTTGELGDIALVESTGTFWRWDPKEREWVEIEGGTTSFLELSDTPVSYTGQAGKAVVDIEKGIDDSVALGL